MTFQREKQRVTASEVLQAMADGEDIKLTGCTVSGEFDISRLFDKEEKFNAQNLNWHQEGQKSIVTFSQLMSFNACQFADNVHLSGPWTKPGSIQVVFKRDVSFNLSNFCGQCRFDGVHFHGSASFDGCSFERVASFRKTRFGSSGMFRTANFTGYALFSGSGFSKDASFTNAHFSKGANFIKVSFAGRTNFSDVYSASKSVPKYDGVKFQRHRYGDGEPFWRFIKQAAQEAGYYQLAGEAFYNERCANFWKRFLGPNFDNLGIFKKALKVAAGVKLLPEFIFGRLLFGYGERPVRVLVAAVIIILGCGTYYHLSDSVIYSGNILYQSPSVKLSWFDSVYFSAITFATLGLGDFYPAGNLAGRIVVMLESLSGACLVALFIVSLAKRFSRG